VLAVASGEDAVHRALSETIHLVLMDSHMPGMDGVAATRLLRQTGFRRPIIAFTAGDQKESDALLAAGCDDVLNKPIDHGHVQALLERYLRPQTGSVRHDLEDEDIERLVPQFLAGLPERRQRMNSACTYGDVETLKFEAHQIKGTAGAMGYPKMTEQAATVEALLKTETPDWEQVRGELDGLNAMIEQACSAAAMSTRSHFSEQ
ncbi:response regulator, partial [Marinobacter alexandrii]|uniref:response regulator n=1 Tax=Marinobacter alexandrii TaxID=2570351 RepID=UPI00329A3E91